MNLGPTSPLVLWLSEMVVFASVAALVWRFGFKHRWEALRSDLRAAAANIEDVHHATTVNGRKDPKNPTLRDDNAAIMDHLTRQDGDIAELKAGFSTTGTQLTRHLGWSEEEVSRLWTAMGKKSDK